MRGQGVFGCVSVRTVMFFLENPDEALTTSDLAAKFGGRATSNGDALRLAVRLGFLARECAGRGHLATFRAGPKLLEVLATGAGRLQA
jgi:hypothetical protein